MKLSEFKSVEYPIGKVVFINDLNKRYKVVERKNKECGIKRTCNGCAPPECDLCGYVFACVSSKCNANTRNDGKNICYKEIQTKEGKNNDLENDATIPGCSCAAVSNCVTECNSGL